MDDLTAFDRPMFKRLSHNDTGAAAGHQGGIVVPKDLSPYFPDLAAKASSTAAPTVDEHIRAVLFIGNTQVGDVETRYQFQTWGGTRSPERRLTANLAPLRDQADVDDFLIIERSVGDPSPYRLRLVKPAFDEFKSIAANAGTRRWGPLYPRDTPVPEKAVEDAVINQEQRQLNPLALFDNAAVFTESRVAKIARSRAFQRVIMDLYQRRCSVCGCGLRTPAGLVEVEGAHLVPRGLKGADDARNGCALCRSHHWAFDKGLFGIKPDRTLFVPAKVLKVPQNAPLAALVGVTMAAPTNLSLLPALEALEWHRNYVVSQWK
jgi:putative restriction endonuclease